MIHLTDLFLIRHGQTQWNLENRIQGNMDSPLTDLGRQQARWLSETYRDEAFDRIYTSTLDRAYETAKILRGDRKIEIIRLDSLKEIHFGEWEGKAFLELREEKPEAFDAFRFTPESFRPAGGETFQEAQNRIVGAVREILRKNRGEKLALVIHGAVLKLLMGHFLKLPINQIWEPPVIHPTSVSHIRFEGPDFEILKFGDISHYKEIDGRSFGI